MGFGCVIEFEVVLWWVMFDVCFVDLSLFDKDGLMFVYWLVLELGVVVIIILGCV